MTDISSNKKGNIDNENYNFFKFMHDIIDSMVWSKLSCAAKTLYPVLCRFSDKNFKYVWPGTEELLHLTGFKSKKSLRSAKKELMDIGLIDFIPGTGRTSSRYYFRFDYSKSRISIDSYRESLVTPYGLTPPSPEGGGRPPLGRAELTPKKIQININNNYRNYQEDLLKKIENMLNKFILKNPKNPSNEYKDYIIKNLLNKYGNLDIGEAIKIAIKKGKNGDINYLEGILRNKSKESVKDISNKYSNIVSWKSIIGKINESNNDTLKENIGSFKYYYKYNNTHYITTNSSKSKTELEQEFKSLGYTVKILEMQNNKNRSFNKFNLDRLDTENIRYKKVI
ncbi:MAG: helix-turn-helix domain-containing protein [Spirochaetia bacterium]|nr:helix-turn-helix domain-containing protein [Spirochaetia bacterium]